RVMCIRCRCQSGRTYSWRPLFLASGCSPCSRLPELWKKVYCKKKNQKWKGGGGKQHVFPALLLRRLRRSQRRKRRSAQFRRRGSVGETWFPPRDRAAGEGAFVNLERALELAKRGRGTTHPNPVVGAVLVRDGEVVGEGWHERKGGPHAELVALAQAGERARGATLYVTMEPSGHHGSTPPCTEALI